MLVFEQCVDPFFGWVEFGVVVCEVVGEELLCEFWVELEEVCYLLLVCGVPCASDVGGQYPVESEYEGDEECGGQCHRGAALG